MSADVKVLLAQILSLTDEIKLVAGPNDTIAKWVTPPDLAKPGALVFTSKAEDLNIAVQQNASIIVASDKILKVTRQVNSTLLTVPNIQRAMALILPLFDRKINRFGAIGIISEKASIHPSAILGENVTVSAFAVIGEGVVIGSNSVIGPHCNIESLARIGSSTILHSFVHIGADCHVGSHCEIHPHTTIGSDGFGFYTIESGSQKGEQKKVPQLGYVIIEDFVEIGGNCAIDRATLTCTRIRRETKIDNLVHIAHNCDIGENSLLAAGFMMAGSSKVGRQFMTGGNSVITSHIEVTDHVALAGRSTVTNNIDKPGAYGGYPLEPLRSALKTIANIGQLTQMRKQINRIMKSLDLKDE